MYQEFDQNWIKLTDTNPIDFFLRICESLRAGVDPQFTDKSFGKPASEGIFCRGEPEFYKESYLVPKIFRKEYRNYEEAEFISCFKASFPEHRKNLLSNIEWLSYMQHYGVPTRLLDWTTNPLVALYFALGNDYELEEDGIVYIAQIYNRIKTYSSPLSSPIRIMAKYFSEFYAELAEAGSLERVKQLKHESIPFSLRQEGAYLHITDNINIHGVCIKVRPNNEEVMIDNKKFYLDAVEVFPPNSHPRIKAQSGRFSIYNGKYLDKKQILHDTVPHEKSFFIEHTYKIIIPSSLKKTLKEKLRSLNITEFSLFPDEDKFCNYFIENKFHSKKTFIVEKTKNVKTLSIQIIEDSLLNLENILSSTHIVSVSVNQIVKVFKILGLRTVINVILKNSLSAFIEDNIDYIFIFKIYNALEQLSSENKGNQKIVSEYLILLEFKTRLLSKTLEIFHKQKIMQIQNLDFDIENNLFEKSINRLKSYQLYSMKKETQVLNEDK